MKKVFIVLLFILLGSALIVVNNSNKNVKNSFTIVYENNENMALPDLIGKQEITDGMYRIYDGTNYTLDYNTYNGIWLYNSKQPHALNDYIFINEYLFGQMGMQLNQNYYFKFYPISEYSGFNYNYRNTAVPNATLNNEGIINVQEIGGGGLRLLEIQGEANPKNITFRLQINKGSYATSYVVPKLVPIYQDNLSMEEKQKIGLGAFGGITKIIKTISDMIKPVGDFINGLLSWF